MAIDRRFLSPLFAAILSAGGCQLHSPAVSQTAPAMTTRFTANPLTNKPGRSDKSLPITTVKNFKVGLAMQSGVDPVQTQFAGRLGVVLERELQLSRGELRVEPLASLPAREPVPSLSPQSVLDVVTVALVDPQDTLPSQLPPNPMFSVSASPIVDQILRVRVIEYRPYFPMLATLEICVLEGETQDPIFSTTATWSGVDYQLADSVPKLTWRQRLFHEDPKCEPSPGHNSPQALMHEISGDISEWYNGVLSSQFTAPAKNKRSFRERWTRRSRNATCPPCELN